jgi:uncharacterized protein (TIGR03066 family)
MRAACLFALCATAPAAPVPKERADAEKVVGTWKLTLGAQGQTAVDLELELQQGGKLVIRQAVGGGKRMTYEGSYRVVGNTIPYEVKYSNGRVKKETLTIKKLTADELIVVDPDGLKEEFKRVKKDDKDEKKGDRKDDQPTEKKDEKK